MNLGPLSDPAGTETDVGPPAAVALGSVSGTVELPPTAEAVIVALRGPTARAHLKQQALKASFAESDTACNALREAVRTVSRETPPEWGPFLPYIETKRLNREAVLARRKEKAAKGRALALAIDEFRKAREALVAVLKDFDGKKLDRRGQAAVHVAEGVRDRIVSVELDTYTDRVAECAADENPPSKGKACPARASFERKVRDLTAALRQVDLQIEKTGPLAQQADSLADQVQALDDQKFTEPQKPTAEELGRYIKVIEQWCRLRLPTERRAAEAVHDFRAHLAGLWVAAKAIPRPLRKLAFIEVYDLDPATEALLAGTREVVKSLTEILKKWDSKGERWRCKRFDNSAPVPDVAADEVEMITLLQTHAHNCSIAVANKAIAHAKWRKVLDEKPPAKVPERPQFHTAGQVNFSSVLATAEKYLQESAEAEALIDQHEARARVCFDAFDARREMARQVTNLAAKTAGTFERSLKHPMSDELRIHCMVAAKLRDIHGSGFFGLGASS